MTKANEKTLQEEPKQKKEPKNKKQFSLIDDLLAPLNQVRDKGASKTKFMQKAPDICAEALQKGFIEEKSAKGKINFCITDEGEKYLLQNLPLARKIEEITKRKQAFEKTIEELRTNCHDLSQFGGKIGATPEFSSLIEKLHKTCLEGIDKINEAIKPMQNIIAVRKIGEEYLEKIRIEEKAFAENLEKAKEQYQRTLEEVVKHTHSVQKEITFAIDSIQKDIISLTQFLNKGMPQDVIDQNKVIASMERIYRSIVAQRHPSTIVSFSELYQKLLEEFPILTMVQFRKFVNKLGETVVTTDMISANDKNDPDKKEFAITSWRL